MRVRLHKFFLAKEKNCMTKTKSVAGGILCIIGAVMAFIGTLYLSICAMVKDGAEAVGSALTNGAAGDTAADNTIIVWILGIAAFVCAIIAAVFCFKNSLVGGILSAVSFVALLVASIVVDYWAWIVIVAMVLLGVGSVLAFVVKKPVAGQTPAAPADNNNTPNA